MQQEQQPPAKIPLTVGLKRKCPQCGKSKDFYAVKCRVCTIPGKPLLGKRGPNHPAWKSGKTLDKDGYVKTYAPDHPWPRKGGYVRENVRVMELTIGRRIAPDESVHHKDANRQNNRLDNLELMKRGQHSSHHRKIDSASRRRNALGRFA